MAVIAIDGPSGSGKSSTSRAVARTFRWEYLDTGALYRALTLLAIENEITDPSIIPDVVKTEGLLWMGDPSNPSIELFGRNVNKEIRAEEVTARVSEVAANDAVRRYLLSIQRSIINGASNGIVVEGRDIGSTVWPDAELKIFLTADVRARAERRNAELNVSKSNIEVQHSLSARDHHDSTRSASPLRQIEDQITIDATLLSLDEVVDSIVALIRERNLDQSGA